MTESLQPNESLGTTHRPSTGTKKRAPPCKRHREYTIVFVFAWLKPTSETAADPIDSGRDCHRPGYFSARRAVP